MSDTIQEPGTLKPVSETVGVPDYVILRYRTPGHGDWELLTERQPANSAESAIRKYVNNPNAADDDTDGTYVAVPKRSWRPVTVKAVQTTVLKLEDA